MEDKTLISETRNEIKKCRNYISAWIVYLPIYYLMHKDTHSQCEYQLSNWSRKWRNLFNRPNFDCKNYLTTPQGLIDHLYATAFEKKLVYIIGKHITIFTKCTMKRLMLNK